MGSFLICMACNVSNYKRNQLIFIIIPYIVYTIYDSFLNLAFFALPFATHSARYLLFTSPRRMFVSVRVSLCVCVCVWMNVNLNELPPCLTFPFAKWEREREIRKHFGPRIETSRYSLCQTRRSFSFLLIFLQKSPVEHAQILSERYVCYDFVFISVSDNIYNCCFFRYI